MKASQCGRLSKSLGRRIFSAWAAELTRHLALWKSCRGSPHRTTPAGFLLTKGGAARPAPLRTDPHAISFSRNTGAPVFRTTRCLLQRVGYLGASGDADEVPDDAVDGAPSSSAAFTAAEDSKEETIVDWTNKPLPADLPRRPVVGPARHRRHTRMASGERKPASPGGGTGTTAAILKEVEAEEEEVSCPPPCSQEKKTSQTADQDNSEGDAEMVVETLLREKERSRFVQAIVKEKLKELAVRQGKEEEEEESLGGKREAATMEALRYQAHVEIQWIEDWAWEHPLVESASPSPAALSQEEEIKQRRLLVKRALLELLDYQKPLPYIIGTHPFYGCVLHCRPPVICPQAETEMWTHWFIESFLKPVLLPPSGALPSGGGIRVIHSSTTTTTPQCGDAASDGGGVNSSASAAVPSFPLKVLDMCCGTGCVGIAMAKHLPQCSVVGVDLNPEAVQLASLNAQANGISLCSTGTSGDGRYSSLQGNMFAALHAGEMKRNSSFSPEHLAEEYRFAFDILVCNPPYLFPEEFAALPAHEQYWLSKLAVLGDPEREGAQQYRYFQELCSFGWHVLKKRRDQDIALRDIPNFVVEVGRQATLVATMMEKEVNTVTGEPLWENVELHLDFNHQPRWVSARSAH